MQRILFGLVVLAALVLAGIWLAGRGLFGSHEAPGEIVASPRPASAVAATERAVADAAAEVGAHGAKQVLFGDFHVHTTFSFDAFMMSMPSTMGEGAHPPADACDFARYCSALDFWSINDHAEALTREHWLETIDSIRACNDAAGDPANPDTVAFLGWEWTQVGSTPENHYGHKNVVLAGTGDDQIPVRPIAAGGTAAGVRSGLLPPTLVRGVLALGAGLGRYHDLARFFTEIESESLCDPDLHVKELPPDCAEFAETPADLYRKLDEWGHDSLVIPHGTTWGMYTPPGSRWDKQLAGDMHDPERQTLIEIYSGHGDSDAYRDWQDVAVAADGSLTCPAPRQDYTPSCWRAGEIIRERCLAEGAEADVCEERAAETRRLAVEAGGQAHLVVDGESAADWLDAGQCRDCDQPAFNYRPGGSAQYITAIGNFDAEGKAPRHFRMGFMASSDNHFARPGTGYKERFRRGFTESRAPRTSGPLASVYTAPPQDPSATPRPFDPENTDLAGFQLFEMERQASFFMTGGLVAVHSEGRDRAAIWDAVKRREVYGTSGPRMLLWFELLNPPGSRGKSVPMGGEVAMADAPIFRARAVGSFAQLPGCPDATTQALSPPQLERLCKGECYHPSDERRLLTRIEVVRIRPQQEPGESLASLIDDPWRRFDCDPDPAGCAVTFSDPDFSEAGRDAVYYVRAYEQPAPAINAGGVRCELDDEGQCTQTNLCPGPSGTKDDCLAEHEPRAWSSPIFVDWGKSAAAELARAPR